MIRGWMINGVPERPVVQYEWQMSRAGFRLVFDPTGDFRPGAIFQQYDVRYSIERGVFATGTLFQAHNGMYVVVGKELKHYVKNQ